MPHLASGGVDPTTGHDDEPGPPSAAPGSFGHLYAQLPHGAIDPDGRGAGFERICRWLLTNDPVLASRITRVWRWEDWPDRFHATDIGVDFVCELVDGGLLAVQAKAWSVPPSFRDLGTWWATSQVRDLGGDGFRFAERLLVVPAGVSERIPAAVFHSVPTSVWDAAALEQLAVTWPTDLDDLPPLEQDASAGDPDAGAREAHQLRAHQRSAVAAAVAELADGGRAQVHMACGTGKTLVAQRCAEQLVTDGELVVVAAPSLALLAQLRREWVCDTARPLAVLPVCSEDNQAAEHDLARTLSATTDADRVARWLGEDHGEATPVIFATYHSLERVGQALATAGADCQLLVCDEAHRLAGRPDERFTAALDDDRLATRRRLLLTATPRVVTAADGTGDAAVASMDDEEVFGPCVHSFGFADAVAAGMLVDYQLVAMGIDGDQVRAQVDQRVMAEIADEQVDAGQLAQVAATVRAITRFGLSRVVVFHNRIDDARSHAKLLPLVAAAMGVDTTGWWADVIVGTTHHARREQLLGRLRSTSDDQVGVLCTARVLSEGVDVPALDAVVFADPKASQVDVVQAVGRVMRTAPGKQLGYVVVPAVVEQGTDLLESGPFRSLAKTLAALAAHDPFLRSRLELLRRARGRKRSGRLGGLGPHTGDRVALDLDALGEVDLDALVEAVSVALVERTTLAFEHWYGVLLEYVAEHGTAEMTYYQRTEDGLHLGGWVYKTARVLGRQGELTREQYDRLDALPGWKWGDFSVTRKGSARKKRVDVPFDQLLGLFDDYREQHGHLRVPTSHEVEHNGEVVRLGERVSALRRLARRGRLPAERIIALDERDFTWSVPDPDWRPTARDADG